MEHFAVHMDAVDYAAFRHIAKQKGLSASAYARMVLLEHLRTIKRRQGKQLPQSGERKGGDAVS